MSLSVISLDSEKASSKTIAEINVSVYHGSCQFVNIILPVSMATVLYRRCHFEDEHIKTFNILGVPYYAFRSTLPSSHSAYKASQDSRKMKKYIDEKHLKRVTITILNKAGALLEKYAFTLVYNSGGDSGFARGRTAERIASKFFKHINDLPDKSKYEENEIDILVEWEFYDCIPKEELLCNFKPSVGPQLTCPPYVLLSKMSTEYHKLELCAAFNQKKLTGDTQAPGSTQTDQNMALYSISTMEESACVPTQCKPSQQVSQKLKLTKKLCSQN